MNRGVVPPGLAQALHLQAIGSLIEAQAVCRQILATQAQDVETCLLYTSTYLDMMQNVARLQPEARINGVTIQNMSSQKRGREVCVGLVTDQPFGPVIAFGAGGTMIELINDRTMELPPLNQFLARRLIGRSRVAET